MEPCPLDIHFDEAERARKFYTGLFDSKIAKDPGMEYYMITTKEGTFSWHDGTL